MNLHAALTLVFALQVAALFHVFFKGRGIHALLYIASIIAAWVVAVMWRNENGGTGHLLWIVPVAWMAFLWISRRRRQADAR